MNLQFVFGNPRKKSTKTSKHKGAKVAKKKRKLKLRRRNPEKFYLKVRRPTGEKNKKGQMKTKVVEKKTIGPVSTSGELASFKAFIRIMKEKVRGLPKKKRAQMKSKIASYEKKFQTETVKRKDAKNVIAMYKQLVPLAEKGDKVSVSARWFEPKSKPKKKKSTKKAAKKSVRKKVSRKKATKKSAVRRSPGVIVLKRKGSKVKVKASKHRNSPGITIQKASNPKRKKKVNRRTRRKSSSLSLASGKSFRLKLKKGSKSSVFKIKANPLGGIMDQFEEYTGHSVAEAGSLALGGALYGAVNGALARYAKPVHSALVKVPVVGTSLPTLIAGALLTYIGKRQNIGALQTVGKGLVGASVVGMGVNAAQMVPALRGGGPMKGVDFTMEGLGEGSEADFGYAELPEGMGEGSEADFGGVDYTMEGLGDDGQMGYDEAYAGVDYTMEGFGEGSEADFGDIPEGLGEGQMG